MSHRTFLFMCFRRHSISPCLGKNVCTICIGSTALSTEGDMTKCISRDMDLRFQYCVIITSVYGGIQLGLWCFPTSIFSNSSLNIEMGWCLPFGWIMDSPGEGDRSQHSGELLWYVDVYFLRLRFRSLWRGSSASHSSSWSTKGFDTF